ncbi:type II toxin-antitoxin system HicA family toxin [Methanoculleus sp. FWC-SCC1]|uniref:Type II toxin-antitoxin system HicA family toxin n=1 Tax=Methanoculleus frigidifontis TaxID=2584085 RepID=A0ABT8MDJ2_9EURY|nr:type II toxin-antitoxin system HicA family toxin [Methanoculleus sp. FWC-SCC1]MDN7026001.1 type II toxin-antitoxin system HicA family toxin [Methanoculleus sp. FWC-SCC1]
MSKVPVLDYDKIVAALQRDGWVVVRTRGSHIRLQKHLPDKTLKLTVPMHKPVKRSTLSHILKQADMTVEDLHDLF